MKQLTDRQQRVFDFIRDYIERAGMPPTRAEIAAALGFRSTNAAVDHLKALAKKGVIELRPGMSRGIRLVQPLLSTPIVGCVAAGQPILAQLHITDHYDIPEGMFRPKADYLLQVRGESMQGIGILDGDLLAVHKTQTAAHGQIVVARIEDEVTVKRFMQVGAVVTLQAENAEFKPIVVDLRTQSLVIEGIGVGIIRNTL